MMEIDLLKKLNHANIVKYYGFEKTSDYLNIILELCENGSLRSLCKNFGKLPEHLGAMYITQVLDGLVYLHDQGVIHRDIKGANILATKDGLVKLADFGVATLSNDVGDMSVAGTPYWMAPEIIELSGATTASDIWSVGCTVIELLDGEPPYHDLPPMGALYRIVQDDHPPIPESVSAIVRDFLMQCFQKDCNLRVSAKKLSKHPWIQMSKKKASGSQRSREKAIPAYEEAVKSVQQWNEALKGSTMARTNNVRRMSVDRGSRGSDHGGLSITDMFNTPRLQGKNSGTGSGSGSGEYRQQQQFGGRGSAAAGTVVAPPSQFYQQQQQNRVSYPPANTGHLNNSNNSNMNNSNTNNKQTNHNNMTYEPEICTDNWDDDFADGITSIQLAVQEFEFRDQDDEISKTIRAEPGFIRQQQQQHLEQQQRQQSHQTHHPIAVAEPENDFDEGDFEDEGQELKLKVKGRTYDSIKRPPPRPESALKASGSLAARKTNGPLVAVDLARSRSAPGQLALSPTDNVPDEFENYREAEDDDFSDLFEDAESQGAMYQDEGLTLQTRLSNHSWFGNDAGSDEEDPFAEVDEGFDEIDLEANIAREKYARTCANIAEQFKLLEKQRSEKQMEEVCDRLTTLLSENPDMRGPLIANHGAIPLLDLIENCNQQSLILKLLRILNMVTRNDFALQESLCLVGAIPVLIRYTSKRYGKEIQLAAAIFIQQICHTNSLTLQMFISCRGLRVLIDFLQGNYSTQRDLVWIAINGIHSVFNLQSMTPRNDFCRLLAKQGLLDPLSATLYNTLRDPQGSSYTEKIVQVLLIFSQGDSPVKELLATRQIIHRMLNSLQTLPPNLSVMMLKCIKNISMNSNTLDVLQTASAIHTLVQVLGERAGPHATDVCNHVLTTLFNLCRINKSRQEEAAQAGIIPHLQHIAESSSPLKQFALPILCDLAHAGRACRNILWNNDCLPVYLRLFKDPYWQVNAMDAVLVWLQDETTDVEQILLQPSSLGLFVQAFLTAKANSFENILEPLYKIIRMSSAIAIGIAVPALFQRLLDRLAHPKAVVRLNLLRILRAIFDVHPERLQLVVRYGIADVVVRIAEEDSAVLVKELAKEILDAFEESDTESVLSHKSGDRSANGSMRFGERPQRPGVFSGNPYDSYQSTGDFFGLRSFATQHGQGIDGPAAMNNGIEADRKDESTPLQQYALGGIFKDSSKPNTHEVEDLFQKEVDDLDVASVMQHRNDPRKPKTRDDGRPSTTPAVSRSDPSQQDHSPRMVRTPYPEQDQDSDSSGSGSGESASDDQGSEGSSSGDEKFVTSRGWIEGNSSLSSYRFPPLTPLAPSSVATSSNLNTTPKARVRSPENLPPTEIGDDNEPQTVRIVPRRPFGHHKSRSLGEVLESCLDEDIEKSHRMLEGVQSEDLSESMILRSGLPKIRLELLDMDRFPVWNRQDLEEEEESEDDDENNRHFDSSNVRVGDSVESGSSSGGRSQKPTSPRSRENTIAATTAEELTRILEEFHGTKRKPRATASGTSSGSSSGCSSEHPTVRHVGSTSFTSISTTMSDGSGSDTFKLQERDDTVPPMTPVSTSTAAARFMNLPRRISDDFSTMNSTSSWDGPYVTCKESTASQPPGLQLANRQEYDDSLEFSDEQDDDDDDDDESDGSFEDEEVGEEQEEMKAEERNKSDISSTTAYENIRDRSWSPSPVFNNASARPTTTTNSHPRREENSSFASLRRRVSARRSQSQSQSQQGE
ncbi:hypothetical protein BGZ83_001019 [Gryganskiella cystojenkinii]|nr:hypothetical protein BGZ83_001019 [Gryganskiella cystojenkinii]